MVESLVGNIPLLLLVVGLVLMVLEAISPGAHLIVIGIALVGAGLVGMVFPPAASPFILAALTLVIGLAAAYVYREFDFYGGKGTARTTDSDSLAGRTGYVTETVTARDGEVKLDGGGFAPYFSARTTDGTIAEGKEVIVLDPGGGNVLTVESLEALGEDEIDRALARMDESSESEHDSAAQLDSERTDDGDDEREPETETERSGN
ncbi:NfeD family protein [Natrinema hispanicum]|uniref:Membrane protein implicated in regulation of membrane protease activity n=1 Tax=Natrinema hispanicum TaxID=392421 RepID=A0A1G6ST65_9EURY|nr:NfeD family protein [Natrinema hispanicum]SDD19824.1 Membrane protein implicated in regulation of membrane protease activity [Natrinema hispanicum]SET90281.1 Membrane protein implicated in regulation of membrane protease activity [Natrinema hispanicum]